MAVHRNRASGSGASSFTLFLPVGGERINISQTPTELSVSFKSRVSDTHNEEECGLPIGSFQLSRRKKVGVAEGMRLSPP